MNHSWQNTLKKLGKESKKIQKEGKIKQQQETKKQVEEIDFVKAMGTVKAIKSSNRHIHPKIKNTPIKKRTTEESTQQHYIFIPTEYSSDLPPTQYSKGGQGKNDIKKLLSGKLSIVSTLDLHGYQLDETQEILNKFIDFIQNRGGVCGEIIHGSGLNSRGFVSNLKTLVRRWLIEHPEVLAYTEPHAKNDGAVLILLKRKRSDLSD